MCFWLNGRPLVLSLQLNASHSFNCTVKHLLYLHSHQAKYMLLSKYQFCRMSLNDLKCQWFFQCCQRCSWDFGPDSSIQDSTMQNGESTELPKQRTKTNNGMIRTVWSSSCNHEKSDGVDPVCYFFASPIKLQCFHTLGSKRSRNLIVS